MTKCYSKYDYVTRNIFAKFQNVNFDSGLCEIWLDGQNCLKLCMIEELCIIYKNFFEIEPLGQKLCAGL